MKRWTNGLPGATKRLGAMMVGRDLSASQPGSARIPMMARSINAPLQRPNTLMQLSRSSILEFRLATHGRAIHVGTARKWRMVLQISAYGEPQQLSDCVSAIVSASAGARYSPCKAASFLA
jgi:hypothetical protein